MLPAFLLPALFLLACGSQSAPLPTPRTTPQLQASATCGPSGSKIAILVTGQHDFKAPPDRIIDPTKAYTATIKTTHGDATFDLAPKDAPNTVNNFVFLACEGFYDGLSFNRVVKLPQPLVVQGGDPNGDGSGGPGYIIDDEISPNLKHDAPGTLALANAGPNTGGSQFYITLAAVPSLDGKYAVFGHVASGMNVVNQITQGDKIISIRVQEH